VILRCPFAILGLDSDHMAACPGYDGEVIAFSMTPTGPTAARTCLHLGAERTMRGFVGGCHHPEAEVVLPAAAALVRADVSRNRPQVVIDPLADAPAQPPAKGTPAA
jgi:hypothetical protein